MRLILSNSPGWDEVGEDRRQTPSETLAEEWSSEQSLLLRFGLLPQPRQVQLGGWRAARAQPRERVEPQPRWSW